MTEKEKMLAGRLYDPSAPELSKRRETAHALCLKYNSTAETDSSRAEILRELLPHLGKRGYIQGPAFFDYGDTTNGIAQKMSCSIFRNISNRVFRVSERDVP